MPDSKHFKWVDHFSTSAKSQARETEGSVSPRGPAANDSHADGWAQYRQWVRQFYCNSDHLEEK